MEVSPHKRLWFRNTRLNEDVHKHLTGLKEELESFLLNKYRSERDGFDGQIKFSAYYCYNSPIFYM